LDSEWKVHRRKTNPGVLQKLSIAGKGRNAVVILNWGQPGAKIKRLENGLTSRDARRRGPCPLLKKETDRFQVETFAQGKSIDALSPEPRSLRNN